MNNIEIDIALAALCVIYFVNGFLWGRNSK